MVINKTFYRITNSVVIETKLNQKLLGVDMTGKELHELLLQKWGKSYDIQLRRTKGKIFVQVMWKYLEQVSFPMTEIDYLDRLEAIATYINGFAAVETVKNYIENTKERPRLGKAVSIPLDLGERGSEWMVEEF